MTTGTTQTAAVAPVRSEALLGTPDSSGWIPPGNTCAYSDECRVKRDACNGNGCPVSDGKTVPHRFSCGWARFIKIVKRPNNGVTGVTTAGRNVP